MPTYLVTGASRGLGYAFIKEFASNPDNKVIGIARNKAVTEEKLAADGIKNVVIYEADILDRKALNSVAQEIENKYDAIDYLILNAGYISHVDPLRTFADYSIDPDNYFSDFEKSIRINVIGQINTINTFIPFVRRSSIKKVIAISTGLADIKFTIETDFDTSPSYSVSKAALNMVVAKYNAIYKSEGILFLSVAPGAVTTDGSAYPIRNEVDAARNQGIVTKFLKYEPDFKGPYTPEESVKLVIKVAEAATLENGGDFLSQFGTKRWL